MAAWLKDPVNVVNYHIYFDVNNENNHELQDWVVWPMHSPNSSAAYIEEFGNQAVPAQVYIGSSNLMAKHSWKCVDVTGWSSADDLELSQYTCVNQQWNQQFYIDHVGSNQYTLKSHHTQKCMDVRGASLASGASIVQNSCNSSESQKFQIKAVSFGLYNVINVKSGKCVAVGGAETSNNGKIVQETCVPGAMHQQFEMNGMGVR
ncbi:MAG: hypothetical protein EOP06_03440 [Proteobacteria bacterium]|nr:MAG: hypothetical protein EOP06_03440 [Pseudomonadota bacterium]